MVAGYSAPQMAWDPLGLVADVSLENLGRPLHVSIIGSGNFGTAIANIVGKNVQTQTSVFDKRVRMWVFEENVEWKDSQPDTEGERPAKVAKRVRPLSEVINTEHENVKYLPGVKLPPNLVAVPDLAEAVRGADVLVWVMPHQFLPRAAETVKKVINPNAISVSLIKGGVDINDKGGIVLSSATIHELTGTDCSVMMGANVANEIGRGDFCEATIGFRKKANGRVFHALFNSPRFAVNAIEDVPAVELCGGLKNIVALGAGFSDAMDIGNNSKAALIRIGLAEMQSFIKYFYPETKVATFLESCGVADLITTCYGGRNRKCAEAWCKAGGKKSWEQIEAELLNGQKIQGTLTAKEVWPVIQKHNLETRLPLLTSIYRISFEGQPPDTLYDGLWGKPLKQKDSMETILGA